MAASRGFFISQFALRISVVVFSMAAIITTVTTKQTLEEYGLIEEFDFRGSLPMRFQVGANAIVGFLCFGSLILVYALKDPKSDPNSFFQLFLFDMTMSILLIAGCAAVTGEMFLGKYGQGISFLKIWSPYCSRVDKFCHTMLIPIAFSYLSFSFMFLLSLMAAHKLKIIVHNN